MAGGGVINALAFSGSNFLFHKLSSSKEERKRHDLAIDSYQKDHNSWIERRQEEKSMQSRSVEEQLRGLKVIYKSSTLP